MILSIQCAAALSIFTQDPHSIRASAITVTVCKTYRDAGVASCLFPAMRHSPVLCIHLPLWAMRLHLALESAYTIMFLEALIPRLTQWLYMATTTQSQHEL